jgi:hypothetical protein
MVTNPAEITPPWVCGRLTAVVREEATAASRRELRSAQVITAE